MIDRDYWAEWYAMRQLIESGGHQHLIRPAQELLRLAEMQGLGIQANWAALQKSA